MSNGTNVDPAVTVKDLGRQWWLLAVFAVITIGFGIVLTFKPGKSVHAIAVLIGIWLFILGAVRLIQAIGATGERLGLVVVGLLSILVGILLLRHTTTTVDTVGFIVGIFWTIGGLAQLFSGFSADEDGGANWWVVGMGVISTDRRHPVPRVPVAVPVDHLRDRRAGHGPLRHRRAGREPAAPQVQGRTSHLTWWR